jgi:hypothetical protein
MMTDTVDYGQYKARAAARERGARYRAALASPLRRRTRSIPTSIVSTDRPTSSSRTTCCST